MAALGTSPRWMQVFVYRDRGMTRAMTDRAAAAGYDALVLTVDNQLIGNRERDLRNGFGIPPRFTPRQLAGMARQLPLAVADAPRAAATDARQLRAAGLAGSTSPRSPAASGRCSTPR